MTVSIVQSRMHFFGHDLHKEYKCTVRYLDDSSWETNYSKSEDGQKFFDRVCDHINLIEKDYFGLRFVDENKQRRWVDLSKGTRNQLKKAGKDLDNVIVCFRVKFYPPDPILRLNEELTRYQLYLQLRRDLQHGRLYGSSADEAVLLACILQSELRNIPPETDKVPEAYRSLMKHGKKGEAKSLEQWRSFRGTSSSECESRFIAKAAELDTFGIDPHLTKNEQNEQVFVGYNHFGIIAFQGSKKIVHLQWAHILRLSYESKTFIVHYVRGEEKKNSRAYVCANKKAAKQLWRNALETKIFFTAPTSKNVSPIANKSTVFSRASRIRFSGRVAREAYEKSQNIHRANVQFSRVPFGQKGDGEVYEGLVATPALHRRPSIFPLPSSALNSVVTTPEPMLIPPFKRTESPPTPPTHPETAAPQQKPESIPNSSLAGSRTVPPAEELVKPQTRPTTDQLLHEVRERVTLTLDRSAEPVESTTANEEVQTETATSPRTPVAHKNTNLGVVAVGALILGTSLLGIYTLFETNWVAAMVNLFEPIRDVIKRKFFS